MTYEELSTLVADNQDTLCYISDPVTYELLYVNKFGRKHLGLPEDIAGQKCYQLLQGKSAPCEFCTNSRLSVGAFHCWDYYNPKYRKHYSLKDTLIIAGGKTLRLELCTDITEQKKATDELKIRLSLEETLVRCIQTLSEEKDMHRAVNSLLSVVGEYYDANRAYIFEFDFANNCINNTYEWCKPGVSAEILNLQRIPLASVENWIKRFEDDGAFFITSLEGELSPDSLDYQILEPQGIQSLMAAPLVSKEKIIGFLGVDDPIARTDDARLLRSVPFFVQEDLEKRRLISELERMSYVDTLTGLYNRNKYTSVLKELDERPPLQMGIVYLDINGLKAANDTYGHSHGDRLITKAAEELRRCFEDTVFRVGGDEFVVLCIGMERSDFERKTAALREHMKQSGEISVSIGSHWGRGETNVLKQIGYADRLMYIDKQSYYKSMLPGQAHHRSGAAQALLAEIAAGKFVVHLQPQVELKTGKFIGAEALVRRKAPSGSLILPSKFISGYEADGIIRHLDFFVLETVCATLQQWKCDGWPLPIAANLSRLTLMEPTVVDEIRRLCDRYGVEPALLHIEVTESISKMDPAGLAELISRFREEGFVIALDDFGSEYSNLAILTAMDFSEIKFDKSLIQNLGKNSKSRIVIEHAIEMCHAFHQTNSLAEGVETYEQMEILEDYQCRYGQGYLFSKPIPINEFRNLYREQLQRESDEFPPRSHP